MLAITEVTDPSLQCWRVVLLDDSAVGLDGSLAGDRCPLARVVDESNVDGSVLLQVVGLARLGVGVEQDVKSVCLLLSVSSFLVNRSDTSD